MVERYKAYNEYKDSPIDWLDKIPAHWTTKKLKHIGEAIIGLTYSPNEVVDGSDSNATLVLRSSNVQEQKITLNDNVFVNKEIPKKLTTRLNDILICSRNGSRALIGKNALIDKGSVGMSFGAFMTIYRSKHNTYLSHVMNSKLFEYQSGSFLTSTINQLTTGNLNSFEIPFPSEKERECIANFLDHETAKIDTLITKQEKLIELLKEKRQAVISHAVTKGLNPDAPMKDSGVEWLGEVPEHWDLKRFKHLFKIRKRIAGKTGYDILSITQKGIKVKDITSGEGQLSMDYSKYQLVYKNDFAMNHMDLLTGFVDISSYNGVTSPDYRVFTLEHKLSEPSYYLRILQMGYLDKLFYPLGQGAAHIGRWRLPTEAFNEFLAPCPPQAEQKEISQFIKTTQGRVDALLEKAEGAIILMKERKTALISAAVTGKIDVRDWKVMTNG
ncbi:restriction endonuclease subunit S [Vibrio sp. 99-8-1]|uniref:restriction endonuclease subunit S n=1 Tax=Vibrio sp. 99-8-1 TaxID=2607602 RepID=UPI001493AFC4|nr:restriction endonuclease subunit S [Vibrio sp. 99-8-1]NOI67787.1 restriction endonuclease subunit S [Vibrio sp. 99-8-1]